MNRKTEATSILNITIHWKYNHMTWQYKENVRGASIQELMHGFNPNSNLILFWLALDIVRCKTTRSHSPSSFYVCGLPTSKANRKEAYGSTVCSGKGVHPSVQLSPGPALSVPFWKYVSEKSCFPGCLHIKFWTPETFFKGLCPHQQPIQRTTLLLWSHARKFLFFSWCNVKLDHATLLRKTLQKSPFTGYHFHVSWTMSQVRDLNLKWTVVRYIFSAIIYDFPEPRHCTQSARVLHTAIICRVKISTRPQARPDSLPSVICVSMRKFCRCICFELHKYIQKKYLIAEKVMHSIFSQLEKWLNLFSWINALGIKIKRTTPKQYLKNFCQHQGRRSIEILLYVTHTFIDCCLPCDRGTPKSIPNGLMTLYYFNTSWSASRLMFSFEFLYV